MHISDEVVFDSPQCFVRRVFVDVPAGSPDALLVTKYRWEGLTSVDMASGYKSAKKQERRLVVTVVGQLAGTTGLGGEKAQRILSMYARGHGAIHSHAYVVDPKATLPELLSIDVTPGVYAMEQEIEIGRLNGDPITLMLSAERLREAMEK